MTDMNQWLRGRRHDNRAARLLRRPTVTPEPAEPDESTEPNEPNDGSPTGGPP